MAQDRIQYEDLEVDAEHKSSGRTVTEADVVNFAGLSADYNNMHIDEEFAKKTVFKTRVAHGMLVTSIATGLWFTMPRLATVAFMGLEDWRFSGAVFPGDTIHITRKLIEKKEHKRPNMGFFIFEVNVHNQKDEVVQKGKWIILVNRNEEA
ncbi:MAG: acyl dehydratase [Candidatus Dadabacteria bacterium]|nr:acyl dehydratase [Gammaproteobacteria bacterium]NIT05484.1 acyl dehydratase [Gammaproteobacteria bacterium]NIT14512.1 acyl dehydratase [Candidatus Dadabacteria bacterium]